MSLDFKNGIIRILGTDGKTVGTGFVVSQEGYFATCAHVVVEAGAKPGQTIRFAWNTNQKKASALVEESYWSDPQAKDIAILSLKETPLPEGVIPLPLGTSFNIEGKTLSTFGFPEARPIEGLLGECRVLGSVPDGNANVLQVSSFQISKGFSGAPVWNSTREVVVGMVKSIIGTKVIDIKDQTMHI